MINKDWTLAFLLLIISRILGIAIGTGRVDIQVQGIVGKNVRLPCDVPLDSDVTLLRWKAGKSTIYSVDFRANSDRPPHNTKDNRLKFIKSINKTPFLLMKNITRSDEKLYTCIISSSTKRTVKYYTSLAVIVPPHSIRIFDKSGREVLEPRIGPFDENSNAEITCQVTGGHPRPTVKWFHGGVLLDEQIDSDATSVLRNVLSYGPLKRADLFTKLTCQTSNSAEMGALLRSVNLDINYRPLTVKIITKQTPLVANAEFKINCSSSGSRPRAKVTWWLGREPLLTAQNYTMDSGNTTLSTLVYTPSDTDEGKILECRSENVEVKHIPLRDQWLLHIHYKPKVNITMEPKYNVKEGDQVVFRCIVNSNPAFTVVQWFHKRLQITPNKWKNLKMESTSLILPSVTRQMYGIFTCMASNPVGFSESDPVVLHVKYIPVCEKAVTIVGASLKETVKIHCGFKSFPPLKSVRWQFNVSMVQVIDIPQNKFTTEERKSVLSYTVDTNKDFGTLLCWGRNELGEQNQPCSFKVIEASMPDKPANCSNVNVTSTSVFVKCIGGNDGGLHQMFHAEVFDMSGKEFIKNVSFEEPLFKLDNMPHSTDFLLTIYSRNSKGRSEKQILQVYTSVPSKDENFGYSTARPFPITPLLGILLGIVGALVFVAIIIMLVMRLRAAPSDKKSAKDDATKSLHMDDSGQLRSSITIDAELDDEQKLKNLNYYESQTTFKPDDEKMTFEIRDDPNPEAEYAELLFNKVGRRKKKMSKKNGKINTSQDSTIYASIDHVKMEKEKLLQRQKQTSVEQKQFQSPDEAPTPPPTPPPMMLDTQLRSPEVLIASPLTSPQVPLEVKPERRNPSLGAALRHPKIKELSPRKFAVKPTNLDRPPIARKPESLKKKKRTTETQTPDFGHNSTSLDEATFVSSLPESKL